MANGDNQNAEVTSSDRLLRVIGELRKYYDSGMGSRGVADLANPNIYTYDLSKGEAGSVESGEVSAALKSKLEVTENLTNTNNEPPVVFYMRKITRKLSMPQDVIPHPFHLGFRFP